uniref:LsmAD domain-containing protein n=1 Tax=Schistosoma mansoni TaxID=6183 RepID=A0A5K4F317_SCHMA
MSGQSQRGKAKSLRARNQRMSMPPINPLRVSHAQNASNDNLGIYANPRLTYILGRHVIGNVGEITTIEGDHVRGVIKAVSPSADLGITYAQVAQKSDKGNRKNVADRTILWTEIKMVQISNVKRLDCLVDDIKTDGEIAKDCSTNNVVEDKELVPFFASSDVVKDCLLDQGSFSAMEMFETNEKMFSVVSTYNDDLREYTTPVDRSAPNFSETEARCAKLAQDITENSSCISLIDNEDIGMENEEEKYSAVRRNGTVQNSVRNTKSNSRPSLAQAETPVSCLGNQLSQVCIQSSKPNHTEAVRVSISVGDALKSDVGPQVNGVSRISTQVDKDKVKLCHDQPTKVSTPACVCTSAPVVKTNAMDVPVSSVSKPSSTEERVKKSTLDPNAPEFQPMGLSYTSHSVASMPPNIQPSLPTLNMTIPHYVSTVNVISQASQLPAQATFIAAGQHMYAPYSYGHQTHIQQLLPTPVCSSGPGTTAQHVRGSALPPSVNQQSYVTHGSNMMHQLGQNVTLGQTITAPQVITGHNSTGRLPVCPSSSVNFTRQRSNDSPSSVTHGTSYAVQQSTMSIPTFQSQTVYQLPNGTFPFLVSSHPPVGLQFLPGPPTAVSSGLMLGGVHVSQPNQQICPTHTIMQMQPAHLQIPVGQPDQITQTTTPQQTSQSQQIFSQHFQDQSHSIQIPSYANLQAPYHHNLMFAPQQNSPGFYPGASAMIATPGVNHIASGLSPIVGQPNPHPLGASVANQSDSSTTSQQLQQTHIMSQPNCQPQQLLQHYPAIPQPHLLQAQQLSAAQHIGGHHLPSNHTYHALMAAMAAGGGVGATQAH